MKSYIKSNNSLSNYIYHYYLAIIPLIVYGIYKNSLIISNSDYFGKIVCLIVIGLGIGYVVEFVYQVLYLKKPFTDYNKFIPLYSLLICMVVPIDCNYAFLILILFASLLIVKFLKLDTKVNCLAGIIILLIIVLQLFSLDKFANSYEIAREMKLSYFDLFLGRSMGGVLTTSNLGCLIGYVSLISTPVYKKEIPFYILVGTILCLLGYSLITYDYSLWKIFLSGFTFFGAIYIAPETFSSSYTKKGKIIYGLLIALLNFILLSLFKIYYSIFIAILVVSLGAKIIDKKWEK